METNKNFQKDNGVLSRLAVTIKKVEAAATRVIIISTTAPESARKLVAVQLPEELFGCLCHARHERRS